MPLQKSTRRPSWDDPLLTPLRTLIDAAGGLAVFAGAAAGRVPTGLVNAGLIEHPASGEPVFAHVAYGESYRVARLDARSECSITVHDGRRWLAAEGRAEVMRGPWDERSRPADSDVRLDPEHYRELLRTIYRAAGGGEHPDWQMYDDAMREEGRVVVLAGIERLYGIYWD